MSTDTNTATMTSVDEVEAYPPLPQAWGAVLMLLAFYILSQLDRNLLSLLAESIKRDLQFSDVQMGLLYGPAFATSFALAALPVGWAFDRYSRRLVLWIGVFVWGLATIGCGAFRNFTGLFLARIGVGAGESVMSPGSQSILPDMFPPDHLALPFSVFSMGAKMGAGVSLVIGGALLTLIDPGQAFHVPVVGDIKGWQVILIAAGIPSVFASFLAFLMPEPKRRKMNSAGTSGHTSYGDFFAYFKKNLRFMLGYCFANISLMIVQTGMTTWTPSFYARLHNLQTEQIAFWLGTITIVGPTVGLPIHGIIVDWLFRKNIPDAHMRYMVAMMLLTTPLTVFAYVAQNTWVSLASFGLCMTLTSAYLAIVPASMQLMLPGNLRGKGASVMVFIISLCGMTLGPAMIAGLTEHAFHDHLKLGWSLAIAAAIGLPATAVGFFVCQKPMRERFARQHGT